MSQCRNTTHQKAAHKAGVKRQGSKHRQKATYSSTKLPQAQLNAHRSRQIVRTSPAYQQHTTLVWRQHHASLHQQLQAEAMGGKSLGHKKRYPCTPTHRVQAAAVAAFEGWGRCHEGACVVAMIHKGGMQETCATHAAVKNKLGRGRGCACHAKGMQQSGYTAATYNSQLAAEPTHTTNNGSYCSHNSSQSWPLLLLLQGETTRVTSTSKHSSTSLLHNKAAHLAPRQHRSI